VEAELAAGARTLGEAMNLVRRRAPKRWGAQRKMDGLWAEFKKIKQYEAAIMAPVMEAVMADLDAILDAANAAVWMVTDVKRRFPRTSARSANLLEADTNKFEQALSTLARIELKAAADPLLANWREAIKVKIARCREAIKSRPE
jgi:hypothetical protein